MTWINVPKKGNFRVKSVKIEYVVDEAVVSVEYPQEAESVETIFIALKSKDGLKTVAMGESTLLPIILDELEAWVSTTKRLEKPAYIQ